MASSAQYAKKTYEIFCKLNSRNTVRKRGRVMCRDAEAYYPPEKAVNNFYNAIIKASSDGNSTLESIILVALRDLNHKQIQALGERLRQNCLIVEAI